MTTWENLQQLGIPPKATLMGSLWPPPKVSKALANAMSPSYASPSPSLKKQMQKQLECASRTTPCTKNWLYQITSKSILYNFSIFHKPRETSNNEMEMKMKTDAKIISPWIFCREKICSMPGSH